MIALGTPVRCAEALYPILEGTKDKDLVIRQIPGQEATMEITGECGHEH